MLTWTPPGTVSWPRQVGTDAVRTLRNVRLGLVTLNVLVTATCVIMLWASWRADIRLTETRVTDAARLTEQTATAMLDKASIVLEVAGAHIERQMQGDRIDATSVAEIVSAHAPQIPELLRITIFDAKGTQVCLLRDPNCKQANISDRDYFVRLHEHPNESIKLYGPYISRLDARTIVLLARSLRPPGGDFAGVATGVVPLQRLQSLVETPDLGPAGSAAIRSASLDLLARHPELPRDVNLATNKMIPSALQAAIEQNPDEGVFRATAGTDGVDRLMAYRRLPRYPLYVQMGMAADDFLASWRRQVAWTLGFLVLFFATSWQVAHATAISLRRQAMAQKLYDQAPCGYHTLNAEGLYLSINATELKWLGCQEQDVIQKLRPSDFFTDEGKAVYSEHFPKLRQTGLVNGVEVDLMSRQGDVRRVLIEARAMTDERTGFWMSNSVMYDITALHQARQQLQALAKEQGAMLDNDLVAIAKLKNRRVLWANQGANRIFGYTQAEWQNMSVRRLYADEATYLRIGQACYGALNAGQPYRTQLQMVRKDATPVWIDLHALYLSADAGEMMVVLADFTPIKLVEEARVRAVELDAQNAQLRETSRLQNEFLSNLSHELRTPLNAIIGFSQILASGAAQPGSPKHASYIKQIGASGKHLLGLIETMLDYATVEAGKMRFAPEPTPVSEALREVIELLRQSIDNKQLDVRLDVDNGLRMVTTDPVRLKQMLLSLLDNAVKFSNKGGQIVVRAHPVDDSYWSLQVQDNGIGIAQSDLPRLFNPFVQLSAGSTKTYGGTGLSLTLLKRLVHAQGGKVDVLSELGQGSLFTLTLPHVLKADGNAPPS